MITKNLDFEQYFKSMPVPHFIVRPCELGEDFVVVHVNDRFLAYLDADRDSVSGCNIVDVFDKETVQHFIQSFEVCFEKKRSVTIHSAAGVPGGVRIYNYYVSPILNDADEVEFIDVMGQANLTSESALQRERDDAISMMTSIFDVGEVGIIITDGNGIIVKVNDSFVRDFGWARDELINGSIASLVTPDERDLIKRNHQEFSKTGVRSSGEMKIVRKDGSIAYTLYTTAIMDLSQSRRFQVTTVMDITLRKQMEETLRQAKDQADNANRAKSTFLANMSHELRTPLNSIIGFSEMMMTETFGPLKNEKYVEYLGDVHGSARHLLEIINEVLDMSKIEAGRIELDESEMDIGDVLISVVRMMDSRAFSTDLILNVDVAENFPNVFGDQKLIRQICINLITNAVKFSPQGGSIDTRVMELDDGRFQITVSDEGPGIAKEKVGVALEPFGQVSDARNDEAQQEGTGLGLPLAKAMVEMHGGTMRIESDPSVSPGTTIVITLPAHRRIAKGNRPAVQYTNKKNLKLEEMNKGA